MDECKVCGAALIYDTTDGLEETAIIWCPNCGKDYTHEVREESGKDSVSRTEREFGCHEIPSLRRTKARW